MGPGTELKVAQDSLLCWWVARRSIRCCPGWELTTPEDSPPPAKAVLGRRGAKVPGLREGFPGGRTGCQGPAASPRQTGRGLGGPAAGAGGRAG